MQHNQALAALADLNAAVVYLMGFSFVVGSICTILMLLLLDIIRRNNAEQQPVKAKATKTTKTSKPRKKRT